MQEEAVALPITIILDQAPDARDGLFRATSPDYPGECDEEPDAAECVQELLHQIVESIEDANDQEPLNSAVTDALLAAGHSTELIAHWDRNMTGGLRHYRYEPETAVQALAEYSRHGIPPLETCGFLALPLSVEDCGKVFAAGVTASACREYVEWSATEKWWHWDFDVVEWAVSGIPADRARMYSDAGCSTDEAVAWEPIVVQHQVSDDDLRTILSAGFSAEDFVANHQAYVDDGLSVADAARMQLALGRASEPRTWNGHHDGSEPPF